MSAAIFLDRDGTIVEDVGYIRSPEELVWLPRAIEALQRLQRGFRLFIVTNQPGIASGAITPAQLTNVHAHLLAELGRRGVHIERIFYCPHQRADGCGCIKPEPYFLERAREEYGVDLSQSYVTGDHPHDVEFARRGGARGIYLLTGHGERHRGDVPPGSVIAADLYEAAGLILQDEDARAEPSEREYRRAAAILREGGTVAFPTETVYGLGANALDASAVAGIYEAKGRPAQNPLIVHVASAGQAEQVAAEFPPVARRLAQRFWPGPLTLVLPKRADVPEIVTAGLPTVAVRVPAHPVARRLLEVFGGPVAAPSANRSGELSPTTAAHVRRSLGGRIGMVLDGGPCHVGVESTILSLAGDVPLLLRPGGVSLEELREVVGEVDVAPACAEARPLSPGRLASHYRPRTPLVVQPAGSPVRDPGGKGLLALHADDPEAGLFGAVEVL
ncbi:MAG: L-threonylcarbamoyladenylate synthase, partial [Planctomycetota bacterium]